MRRVLIYLTLLAVIAWHYEANAAELRLSWADNSKDEEGFRIERKKDTREKFEEITVVGPNVTSYIDTSVEVGETYCYRVRAFTSVGNSAYSQEICTTAGREGPAVSKAIRPEQSSPPVPIGKDSTAPEEGVKRVAIIKTSSGGFLGLLSQSPNTSILSVDGMKVDKSESVEVLGGPHVIEIECIATPGFFSSKKIKQTYNYDLQAKGGHTYQINAELVGGLCKVWIDDTSRKEASLDDN